MAVAGLRAGGDIAGTTASSRTRIRVNMEDPNDYASDVAAPDAAPGTTDSDTAAVNGGDLASELAFERGDATGESRRIGRGADVDAVAEDDGVAGAFGKNTPELAPADVQIVWPLQRRRQSRRRWMTRELT